jgi:hypothetical protein
VARTGLVLRPGWFGVDQRMRQEGVELGDLARGEAEVVLVEQ